MNPGPNSVGPERTLGGPVPCVPGPEMSGMSGMGLRIMPGIIAIILWWLCVQHILIWSNQHRNATSFYLSEKSLEYQVTGSHKQHCWGSGKGSANICILADRCNEGSKFNVNWIVIENKSNTNLTRNEIYEPKPASHPCSQERNSIRGRIERIPFLSWISKQS